MKLPRKTKKLHLDPYGSWPDMPITPAVLRRWRRHNRWLARMRYRISAAVQNSWKLGTEIPEAMKPLIEQLQQTGQLLDENGVPFTSQYP